MKQQKLARHVTVAGTTYGPGDDVPADIAEKITNPKAWLPLDAGAIEDEYAGREGGTASGHKLATAVTVGSRTYGPSDFVPDDVASQITNPKAWEGGKLPTAKAVTASPTKTAEGSPDKGEPPARGATEDTAAPDTDKPRKAATPAKRS